MIQSLEPRVYRVGGEIIQDQFTEVFEIIFIMKGKVGVGYRLFNEIFLGMALRERMLFNAYALLQNKDSEF